MAKAPIAGTVKTRLVPPLAHDQAADLSRALLLDQLEHLAGLRDVALYVAFTPPQAEGLMQRIASRSCPCFPQQGGDLGERMRGTLAELWGRGHRNAAIIGSDVVPPPLEIFYDAFQFLSSADPRVVLGPSRDGGYYLIGMNRPTPEIFADMTWSHDGVLRETTARLVRLGVDYRLLPAWFDVDTAGDLELLQSSDPSVHGAMKRTVNLLRRVDLWPR
jgi:rSAM/selenodomain-associated transferase 1